MTSADRVDEMALARVRNKARAAYERGRLWRASLGACPLLLPVGIALFFAGTPGTTLALGLAAAVLGAGMLWYGRDVRRGFWGGAALGCIPLVMALVANNIHTCAAGTCSTWCLPACSCGGFIAGALLAYQGFKRRARAPFWLSASGMVLLVGAMGCSCIGASGVVGMVFGFALGLIPGVSRLAWNGP